MGRFRLVAFLVGGVLLGGCGSAQTSHSHAAATARTPSTSVTSANAAAATPRKRIRPWYRRGLHTLGFQSPTGNIRCALQSDDHTQLLCTTLNNGKAVDLDQSLDMNTNWRVTIPSGNPTLAYGRMWWSTNFVCWSQQDATYCRSLYSRHGFRIDRDAIQDRIWPRSILDFGGGGGGTYVISGGSGYTTRCNDGSISSSGGIQGACSWHGGVAAP